MEKRITQGKEQVFIQHTLEKIVQGFKNMRQIDKISRRNYKLVILTGRL